ncbi:hypothetical protein [Pseudopedobacter beijingensis]|uniref:DUF4861 domain-containing protein n=1 Tax=Pseudopedobacter beijingensis TaxID=1207056 RepID=A0ABW4IBQ9_9SPHI
MKTNFTSKLMTALIGVSLLATTSCKKNSSGPEIDLAAPSAASFQELRKKTLEDMTQTQVFKAEDGINFTSAKGVEVKISPNCLVDENNNPVTGNVTISFIEIFDRGSMVLANKPVMGRNNNGDVSPLVTGGQYNIKIMQGNKEVKPGCSYNVSVPANNTGAIDTDMLLWRGTIDQEGNLVWDETGGNHGKEAGMNINTERATYAIWDNEFGWTNVDRFYSDARPKTQIKVTVPSAYNKDNAGIYLAYEGEPNVLAQLDTYDMQDHFFSEHYGFIPVGLTLHVIFMSENNGSVAYAIKKATIVANGTIAIGTEDIKTTSKSQLINMINALN